MNEPTANACYSCGYSLTGLALADGLFKCPECGALQTVSYTTEPRIGAWDLVRQHPVMLASPIAVAAMLGGVEWGGRETVVWIMVFTGALLWNLFVPALFLLITVAMFFVRAPGLLQRALFFTAWLAVGVASLVGMSAVLRLR